MLGLAGGGLGFGRIGENLYFVIGEGSLEFSAGGVVRYSGFLFVGIIYKFMR